MKQSQQTYEMISHSKIKQLNLFLMTLSYRAPHFHNDFEISVVIQGVLDVKTSSEKFSLSPGEVALFNPNELHTLQGRQTHCILLCIHVSPSFFVSHFPLLSEIRFLSSEVSKNCSIESIDRIRRTCYEAAFTYEMQMPGYELQCASDIYRIFGSIIQCMPYENFTTTLNSQNTSIEPRVDRILTYIHQHYREKLTLTQIAQHEKVSLSYLSRFFKKKIGINFQEYIVCLRLEYAVHLLKKSHLNIIDICLESGFSDSKYLNKHIKQMYSSNIQEFREKTLEDPHNCTLDSIVRITDYPLQKKDALCLIKNHLTLCDYT